MTNDPSKPDAELDGAAAERMEELVEQSIDEMVETLDLENAEPVDEGLDQRIKNGTVTETDMINKSRTALYKMIDNGDLGVRDLATIYITGLRVEEARLRVKLKSREKDEGAGAGVKELREKAARAMRGGGNDDE